MMMETRSQKRQFSTCNSEKDNFMNKSLDSKKMPQTRALADPMENQP